jgi:hypothetical protein
MYLFNLPSVKKYDTEINFDDFTTGEITNIGQFCRYIEDRMALA